MYLLFLLELMIFLQLIKILIAILTGIKFALSALPEPISIPQRKDALLLMLTACNGLKLVFVQIVIMVTIFSIKDNADFFTHK